MPLPNLTTAEPERLLAQLEAWMEGASARASGQLQLHECPYLSRSWKGDAWENGWEMIDQDLKSAAPDRCLTDAAPELLDACQQLMKAVDSLMGEFISQKEATNWSIVNGGMCAGRKAIAKATKYPSRS